MVSRLLEPAYLKRGGEAAQDLLGALKDQLEDGYSVELRFVTNLRLEIRSDFRQRWEL